MCAYFDVFIAYNSQP